MPDTNAARILIVGQIALSTSTLQELQHTGCHLQVVNTSAEAEAALQASRFQLILSAERLPDGLGYGLTDCVAACSSSLLVCIAMSASSLWLPVVQNGARILGERAIKPWTLRSEIADILRGKRIISSSPRLREAWAGR